MKPPGYILAEEIRERGWTQKDLADKTGLSLKTINALINGKIFLSLNVAKRLGNALGTSKEFWLNLEEDYRNDQSRFMQ
jgi:addiction module HigA family antidote